MKVKIVPSTSDGRHQLLTSYVVNDTLAIDAGALAIGLSRQEQLKIRSIVITHAHLDHVISLPFFLMDLYEDLRAPVDLYATKSDFAALRRSLFNSRVWVEIDVLKNDSGPLVMHRPYRSGETFEVDGMRLTTIPVTHTILTHGILVEDSRSAVLFTSDTGATDRIWQTANECMKLRAVFIDLSFPSRLTELARASCHHSPETLVEEIAKLRPGVAVVGIHLKTPYRDRIISEVNALNEPRLQVADVGRTYEY